MSKTILTGERPIGQVRTVGDIQFLEGLFAFQETHRCFYMIADYQAFATQVFEPLKAEERVRSLVCDYVAAGFDPDRSCCFLQSQVPQLFELAAILSNLVTVQMLEGVEGTTDTGKASFGFLGFPVSQAADILLFRADLVPARPDQQALVELAADVAARFNRDHGDVFVQPEGTYSVGEGSVGDSEEGFRERRATAEREGELIRGILSVGGSAARVEGQRTLERVKEVIGSTYPALF
jgi:tryptophanyl-tRNA synthetase